MFQVNQEKDGHAWNIVTIDGKNYPIDLTWDNSKFRRGDIHTIDFLGQDIKKFKKCHIPQDQEPCKNFVLSELDCDLIKSINLWFLIEEEYSSTSYCGFRKDGSRYLVIQIANSTFKEEMIYRYYYADLDGNGKISNPAILYSETNLANYMNSVTWNKPTLPGYEEAIDNVLFSKENIKDSLMKGTGYIGKVTKERKEGEKEEQVVESVSDIYKPIKKQKALQYSTKVYKRDDGTIFLAEKMTKVKKISGTPLMAFHIFEIMKKRGKKTLRKNIVVTEKDFFQDNSSRIPNEYLSRKRLDQINKENSGYIGYYDESGREVYNPDLVRLFKTMPRINQTPSNKENSIDTQVTPKQTKDIGNVINYENQEYLVPNDVVLSTLAEETTRNEIDDVINEIKKEQTKDSEQFQQR